ncbi:MAG: hypothetical protein JW959_15000 [Pirellulales bacterium]|nr:hypothetical protein [Pirellulales bacterium]
MNLGGWIVMVLAVGGVTALLAWCIYKVIATPGSAERLHSTADIETPDIEEEEEEEEEEQA